MKKNYDPIMMAGMVIEWLRFPYGAKADIVERYAKILGVSKQQMYRLLREFNDFRPYIEAQYGCGKHSEKRINRLALLRHRK